MQLRVKSPPPKSQHSKARSWSENSPPGISGGGVCGIYWWSVAVDLVALLLAPTDLISYSSQLVLPGACPSAWLPLAVFLDGALVLQLATSLTGWICGGLRWYGLLWWKNSCCSCGDKDVAEWGKEMWSISPCPYRLLPMYYGCWAVEVTPPYMQKCVRVLGWPFPWSFGKMASWPTWFGLIHLMYSKLSTYCLTMANDGVLKLSEIKIRCYACLTLNSMMSMASATHCPIWEYNILTPIFLFPFVLFSFSYCR